MKTLYVSDLDGTLLTGEQILSPRTLEILNRLIGKGMHFAYATARSLITAKQATAGLSVKTPRVVYNGAFVMDGDSGEVLLQNYFPDHAGEILERLIAEGIYPMVYSMRDGRETMAFLPDRATRGLQTFLETRRGDPRWTEVDEPHQLLEGDVFYILINSNQVTGSMLIRQVLASAGMTSLGNDSAFPVSPTLVPEAYHGICWVPTYCL